MGMAAALKRWRENYYVSAALAGVMSPLYRVSARVAEEITRKIRKNSLALTLPNGRVLRLGRDCGVGLASNLYWHGLAGYEPETSRTLCFFFPKVKTFADVGANYGYYSLLAALWNPKVCVLSFEPVPQICEGLKRNVEINGLQGQVTCHGAALSDRSGSATFFLPNSESKDVETTGTLVSDGWQSRKRSPSFAVEAIRFDDFEKTNPVRLDLVKIDVEDFEAAVLDGMRETIRRDRPFIVCEILPREHGNERTRSLVESLNYTAYWITPAGYIRVSRFDFARQDLQDFLLSPVCTPDELVTDLNVLWMRREELVKRAA